MSKKSKKRRRRPAPVSPSGNGASAAAEPKSAEAPPARRRLGEGLFRPREAAPSPYPPLGVSMARGMLPVGSSPAILAVAFLSLLVLWGGASLAGRPPDPRGLLIAMSLPPGYLLYDLSLAFTAQGTVAVTAAVFGGVLVRGVIFGALNLMVVDAIRDGRPGRTWPSRLPRVAARMFLLLSVEVAAFIALLQVLQTLLGGVALLVAWALLLYLLGFAPVILAAEDTSLADALRRSVRAARLPGPRHLLLVIIYTVVLNWLIALSLVSPATPSALTWAFAMLTTFVHLAVLAAIAYRWLAVRELVPPSPPPVRRSRAKV